MKQNTGLHAALATYMARQPSEATLHLDAILRDMREQVPKLDRRQCANSLAYLVKKGGAYFGHSRGTYVSPKRVNGSTNPEAVIIDNLLNAMAEAAPIIARWKRLQAALDSIK